MRDFTLRSDPEACGPELVTVCINWESNSEESGPEKVPPMSSLRDDVTGMTSSPHGQVVPVMVQRGVWSSVWIGVSLSAC